MNILDKNTILGVDDLPLKEVDMKPYGWGGRVNLRAMTCGELEAYEYAALKAHNKQDMQGLRVKLISMCLVDSKGERLFVEDTDLQKLSAKSSKALSYLYDECEKLNSMDAEAIEEAGKL